MTRMCELYSMFITHKQNEGTHSVIIFNIAVKKQNISYVNFMLTKEIKNFISKKKRKINLFLIRFSYFISILFRYVMKDKKKMLYYHKKL